MWVRAHSHLGILADLWPELQEERTNRKTRDYRRHTVKIEALKSKWENVGVLAWGVGQGINDLSCMSDS